jgi:serine phosphatase RsbU (regulator of sigma subunit)/GAF domain-containing protein
MGFAQAGSLLRLPTISSTSIPLLIAAGMAYLLIGWQAWRYVRFRRRHAAEIQALADIQLAFARSSSAWEELAETAYVEAARLFEVDFFQLGLLEDGTYRTLIWIRDGDRQPNQSFAINPPDEGLVGWVLHSNEALLVKDFHRQRDQLPSRPRYDSSDPPNSAMFMPLRIEGKPIGVTIIQSRRPAAFDQHDLSLFGMLANAAASAFNASILQTELDRRTRQLGILNSLSNFLISTSPTDEGFGRIAALISNAFDSCEVELFGLEAASFVLRAAWPLPERSMVPESRSPGPLGLQAMAEGRPQLSPSDSGKEGQSLPSEAAIPLKAEDQLLGLLCLHHGRGRGFSVEQLTMAELMASQLAAFMLEAGEYLQQQEYIWINTVLLEVARHAAQPGDLQTALQAVLQLTTLLVGTEWALVLLPADGAHWSVGPAAGLRRQALLELQELQIAVESIDLGRPGSEPQPRPLVLPDALATRLGGPEATGIAFSDGRRLLGGLLVSGHDHQDLRLALLAGIANQLSLRLENNLLSEEAAIRRSLERELAMGRDIQRSFLPKSLPEHPGWQVSTLWRSARQVGGDFFDFIPLPPGPKGTRWGLVIADVADKGVPAALFMALCRTLLRSVAISRVDPGSTLGRLNDLIIADSQTDLFVSVFYAVWEPDAARLAYANGGHNPPLLIKPDKRLQVLDRHGMVLGVLEGAQYRTHIQEMPPDSMLLCYTDGVTEAMDASGAIYGVKNLEQILLSAGDWSAEQLTQTISDAVTEFTGDDDPSDDLTLIALRRLP